MTANNSNVYLTYLIRLVYQYNNTYHDPINKKPINADYSALPKNYETNSKLPKFKVYDRVRIANYIKYFQ